MEGFFRLIGCSWNGLSCLFGRQRVCVCVCCWAVLACVQMCARTCVRVTDVERGQFLPGLSEVSTATGGRPRGSRCQAGAAVAARGSAEATLQGTGQHWNIKALPPAEGSLIGSCDSIAEVEGGEAVPLYLECFFKILKPCSRTRWLSFTSNDCDISIRCLHATRSIRHHRLTLTGLRVAACIILPHVVVMDLIKGTEVYGVTAAMLEEEEEEEEEAGGLKEPTMAASSSAIALRQASLVPHVILQWPVSQQFNKPPPPYRAWQHTQICTHTHRHIRTPTHPCFHSL